MSVMGYDGGQQLFPFVSQDLSSKVFYSVCLQGCRKEDHGGKGGGHFSPYIIQHSFTIVFHKIGKNHKMSGSNYVCCINEIIANGGRHNWQYSVETFVVKCCL